MEPGLSYCYVPACIDLYFTAKGERVQSKHREDDVLNVHLQLRQKIIRNRVLGQIYGAHSS